MAEGIYSMVVAKSLTSKNELMHFKFEGLILNYFRLMWHKADNNWVITVIFKQVKVALNHYLYKDTIIAGAYSWDTEDMY